ncbi:MAG: phosphatidate cytidylyltransferase [Pseudomonadota bacterium]
MLLTRIITALVLAPTVLAGVFFLDGAAYALFILAISAGAAVEWGQLCGLAGRNRQRWPLVGYLVGYLLFSAMVLFAIPALKTPLLIAVLALWLALSVHVLRFKAVESSAAAATQRYLGEAAAGYPILAGTVVGLVTLREVGGPVAVLLALLAVWLADIGAYFAGRQFGRRKLAPNVSPGKTWEGALGGIAIGTLTVLGALAWLDLWSPIWLLAIPLGIALSIFGDLYESTLKRRIGVKDSGRMLPGHGGLLDRIDALLPAMPAFALVLIAVGPAA